jgi:tripartite-type tricarboxylate transporter receptor subunit TctC
MMNSNIRNMEGLPKSKAASLRMRALGFLLLLAVLLSLSAAGAASDPYPSRPVRLIIAFAAGGSNDIVGRLIAAKLSERLGKQVIAENRVGAGGTVGTEAVMKSAPDGYTLLSNSAAYVINPLLYRVPYDPIKSFIPVALTGMGPMALAVYPGVQANSVKEFVALAKKQPGKLVCASSGAGGYSHLAAELLKTSADIDFKIVQFKGGGPAVIDTMGGHSQISLLPLISILPHIKSGKLRALGVSGSARSPLLPDVPTISEAGVPGYEAIMWWGIFAPAATPTAVVDRLNKELAVIMNAEDTKKKFESQGASADLLGPAAFGKFLQAEAIKWGKVIKEGNIKGEE